jgi:hypothetical protein
VGLLALAAVGLVVADRAAAAWVIEREAARCSASILALVTPPARWWANTNYYAPAGLLVLV